MTYKIVVYTVRIFLTLLILLIIAFFSHSFQCEAVPLCNAEWWIKGEEIPDEKREVTIRVPNSYPGNKCGLICGSPEEEIWWEGQNHLFLPKWSSWVFVLLIIAGVYFAIFAIEYVLRKVLSGAK